MSESSKLQVTSRVAGKYRKTSRSVSRRARAMRNNPTPSEQALWERLRKRQLAGHKFRRQHPIGSWIADFYCHQLRLVLELDGSTHRSTHEQDQARTRWLQAHGVEVIRFSNAQVLDDIEGVLFQILQHIKTQD